MINIEPQLYTQIADRVLASYPNTWVTNVYTATPPMFPCVYCTMEDNSVFRRTRSSTVVENHGALSYRVEVFSNRVNEAKYEAEDIMAAVDEVLESLNFTRTSCSPAPNLYDASVYRLVAHYRAIVGKDHTIYRR